MRKFEGPQALYYLSQLTAKELKEFREFLKCPLLGNSEQGILVLEHLLTQMDSPKASFSAARLHAALFPSKGFDRIRKDYVYVVLQGFQERLMDFLALKQFVRDARMRQMCMLVDSKLRGWEKNLRKASQRMERLGNGEQGSQRFYLQFRVAAELNEARRRAGECDSGHIQNVMERLDVFFIQEKLKYACASTMEEIAAGDKPVIQFLDCILSSLQSNLTQLPSVIQSYFHAYRMLLGLSSPDKDAENHFSLLEQFLFKGPSFEPDEAFDLIVYGLNFSAIKLNQGRFEYFHKVQALLDHLVKSGILAHCPWLPPELYINLVQMKCRQGDVDFAQRFTEEFRGRIQGQEGESVYEFNQAVALFYKGQLRAAVKKFHNLTGSRQHGRWSVSARIYICKALFQLGDFHWLTAVLKAFQLFAKRNRKFGKAFLEKCRAFCRHLMALVKVLTGKPDLRQSKLQSLRKKLLSEGQPMGGSWVLEQVEARLAHIS